jgi:opacity protein-like surface antigen
VTPSARSAFVTLAATAFLACVAAPCRAASADEDDGDGSADDAKKGGGDASAEKGGKTEAGDAGEAKKDEAKPADQVFGHAAQLGLRAGIVLGYRMVLRYDSSPYCAPPKPGKQPADQQRFCGYPAPLSVDLGLSFGVVDFFEPFAWARFGLGADTHSDTNPLIMIGAGARLYTMSDAAFKIFIEPAVALEFEDGRGTAAWQTNSPVYKTDLVFHLAAGPQIDFHPNFGAYVTGGVSMGVVRALASSLDLNIGIQGRYP